MIAVGAVLNLKPDANGYQVLQSQLADDPRIMLGERTGHRWPLSAATMNKREDRELWETISQLPLVSHIDFIFATFEDDEDTNEVCHES